MKQKKRIVKKERKLPLVQFLRAHGACTSAIGWARRLPKGTTDQEAWNACPDDTWLYYMARRAKSHSTTMMQGYIAASTALIYSTLWNGLHPALQANLMRVLFPVPPTRKDLGLPKPPLRSHPPF